MNFSKTCKDQAWWARSSGTCSKLIGSISSFGLVSKQDHLFPKMKDSSKMTNFRGITVFIDNATFTKNYAFKTIYGVLAWPFQSNKWVVPDTRWWVRKE